MGIAEGQTDDLQLYLFSIIGLVKGAREPFILGFFLVMIDLNQFLSSLEYALPSISFWLAVFFFQKMTPSVLQEVYL